MIGKKSREKLAFEKKRIKKIIVILEILQEECGDVITAIS